MRGLQFSITVLVFVGLIWVLNWLFVHFDISYGAIKESYIQILVFGLPLFFITALYDQQLKAIGWPSALRIAPAALISVELILPNLSPEELWTLRGLNLGLFILVALKGKEKTI